jgi:hypothetical protein
MSWRSEFFAYLKAAIVVLPCLGIILALRAFYDEKQRQHERAVRQANLQGICEKTGTNLYETLGAEGFFNMIQKKWLEEERKMLRGDIKKYGKSCAQCGLYLLSHNVKDFDRFLNLYRHKALEQFVPNLYFFDVTKILVGMSIKKIDVNQPITVAPEGIFLSKSFLQEYVTVLFPYEKDNLYTLEEAKREKSLVDGIRLHSANNEREYGWANFYMRYQGFVPSDIRGPNPKIEQLMKGVSSGIMMISNCGDKIRVLPDMVL